MTFMAALSALWASSTTTLGDVTAVTGSATANPTMWYITRAAAISAYITLTVTVILGLFRSLVRVSRIRSRVVLWLLDEAHPFLAVLTAAFVALHLLSLLLDPLIPFAPLNLLVPVAEPYRPFAVDLGVLALYGLLILWFSSWLRRAIGHTTWRALHYTSFALFVVVSAHGILAGTDASQPWMWLVYLGGSGTVLLLVLARLFMPPMDAPQVSETPSARRQWNA